MVPSDLESRFMSDDISPEEMDRQVLEYQEKLYRVWSPEEAEAYEAELARLGHLEVAKRMGLRLRCQTVDKKTSYG